MRFQTLGRAVPFHLLEIPLLLFRRPNPVEQSLLLRSLLSGRHSVEGSSDSRLPDDAHVCGRGNFLAAALVESDSGPD